MRNTLLAVTVYTALSAGAGEPAALWSEVESGLRCAIVAGSTNVKTGQPVELMFVLTNMTEQPISVPVPDPGTLSFNTAVTDKNRDSLGAGGHTALAANPGSRDRWTMLAPHQSMTFSFNYSWREVGSRQVYFKFCSRFEDRPFKTMQSPKVTVAVTGSNGQQGGAANGSQPIRSQTNQTSSAAGSRR